MKPKPRESCPACGHRVTYVIVANKVVMAGEGDLAAKRRCIDCWNYGREPAKIDDAGAFAASVAELHSAGADRAGASAPLPVAGSGA